MLAIASWPQASAASVSSCCTAETWMAEISARLAQADDMRASAIDCTAKAEGRRAGAQLHPIHDNLFDLAPPGDLKPICRGSRQAFAKRELSDWQRKLQHLQASPRFLVKMRKMPNSRLCLPFWLMADRSALAFRLPDTNAAFPTATPAATCAMPTDPSQPYAMNYTDEAAQSLGVQDGQWEAFRHPVQRSPDAQPSAAGSTAAAPCSSCNGTPANRPPSPAFCSILVFVRPLKARRPCTCAPRPREDWTWHTKSRWSARPAMSGARCSMCWSSANFPISEVVALASTRSVGTEVSFGDGILKVKALDYFDFKGTDIVPDERRRRRSPRNGRPRSPPRAPS